MKSSNRVSEKDYLLLKKKNKIYLSIIILFIILGLLIVFLYFNRDIIKSAPYYVKMHRLRMAQNKNYEESIRGKENNHNSLKPLELHCEDGSSQAYHPKVISFDKEWNGYKYWLTYSPFPYGDEKYENPHVEVSNDLFKWEEPKGLENPVEPTPSDYVAKKVYNSDPHLVYNKDKDELELYWRYVNDIKHEVIIYRKITKDGVKWSDKEVILKADRTKKDYISPAIIYEDGIYKMFFVDRNRSLKYMESEDGKTYKNERIIVLTYPIKRLVTWHLDVIHTEKGYELITVAYHYWEDRNSMNLYYFNSKDTKKWSEGKVILRPSVNSWDNKGIYRSSILYDNDKYYIFYSGIGSDMERGIGIAYGSDIYNLIGSSK